MPAARVLAANEFAYAIRDELPVTPLHTLVIPRRHVTDYFGLTMQELRACNALLFTLRNQIQMEDLMVAGFTIGVNAGIVAGQTILHCHIHLIPRREGDVEDPRGGVRHVIAGGRRY
jgi:ATP adenylyltransferase